MSPKELKEFLDIKYNQFNAIDFIELDPVSIPHRFHKKEDIEISGFLTATIAWGNRKSILKSASSMMQLMDDVPHEFVMQHSAKDLKRLGNFVHRTFNGEDLKFFIQSLKNIYFHHSGLENVFASGVGEGNAGNAIACFKNIFFEIKHPHRTRKHISDPSAGSSAKRLNMYLRWMCRKDNRGVDFGIWNALSPAKLMMPLDVHTGNISRKLGLLQRKQNDWKAVEELTFELRKFDPNDPVKYDFTLFGLGVREGLKLFI